MTFWQKFKWWHHADNKEVEQAEPLNPVKGSKVGKTIQQKSDNIEEGWNVNTLWLSSLIPRHTFVLKDRPLTGSGGCAGGSTAMVSKTAKTQTHPTCLPPQSGKKEQINSPRHWWANLQMEMRGVKSKSPNNTPAMIPYSTQSKTEQFTVERGVTYKVDATDVGDDKLQTPERVKRRGLGWTAVGHMGP